MLRPKKLDIYLIKKFLLLFAGAFFICLFVLMMQFLWRIIDELIGKGLTLDILAQFFWYLGLMLMPQAFPLAILLSSLITFGNLGESIELTAIKAAGISLMKAFRSLIAVSVLICCCSFYFQNVVGPNANKKFYQLLLSMKQTSPELEIPEGSFYDGIPDRSIYVKKKDMQTGKLYDIMIYNRTGGFEDQAIILADSGMLQVTADKNHLQLSLWMGEWFENVKSQEMLNSASVPFRRETFTDKKIILDYSGDFNLTDASNISGSARTKGLLQITHDIDSLNNEYDSIGRANYEDMSRSFYSIPKQKPAKSLAIAKKKTEVESVDSMYSQLGRERKKQVAMSAMSNIQSETRDLEFRSLYTKDGERNLRMHQLEAIAKFTLSFCCILFFFIGAPLGSIIRKGGLGMPIVISVLVFIFYYILENSGTKMARAGSWNLYFGAFLSTGVLTPLAAWVTYKANNDSAVFNMDLYKEFFRKLLGLRIQRHIFGKEVIIQDPDYKQDAETLISIYDEIADYTQAHSLKKAPNPIKVFFRYEPDHNIERINETLETVIEDLSNTRNKVILAEINNYPILSVKAHTRPFDKGWMNAVAGIVFPIGIILYIRMWRFRLRLNGDLNTIKETNRNIIREIRKMDSAD